MPNAVKNILFKEDLTASPACFVTFKHKGSVLCVTLDGEVWNYFRKLIFTLKALSFLCDCAGIPVSKGLDRQQLPRSLSPSPCFECSGLLNRQIKPAVQEDEMKYLTEFLISLEGRLRRGVNIKRRR